MEGDSFCVQYQPQPFDYVDENQLDVEDPLAAPIGPASPFFDGAVPAAVRIAFPSAMPPPPTLSAAGRNDWTTERKPVIYPAQMQQVRFAHSVHPYARAGEAPQRVKRPMNSFMVFSNEMRPLLQEQNKSLTNNDVSKILGNMWKDMPADAKKPYIERALAIKASFNLQHPDYVYTKSPRKRSKNLKMSDKMLESLDAQFGRTPVPIPHSVPEQATPEYVRSVAVRVADEMHCTFESPQCILL